MNSLRTAVARSIVWVDDTATLAIDLGARSRAASARIAVARIVQTSQPVTSTKRPAVAAQSSAALTRAAQRPFSGALWREPGGSS